MRVVYCVVPGCRSNNIQHSSLAFFSLPRDDVLLKQWTTNMNMPQFIDTPIGSRCHTKVCALHFETTKFRTPERRKLNCGAVPTLLHEDYALVSSKIPSEKKIIADPSESKSSTSGNRDEKVSAEPLEMLITSSANCGGPMPGRSTDDTVVPNLEQSIPGPSKNITVSPNPCEPILGPSKNIAVSPNLGDATSGSSRNEAVRDVTPVTSSHKRCKVNLAPNIISARVSVGTQTSPPRVTAECNFRKIKLRKKIRSLQRTLSRREVHLKSTTDLLQHLQNSKFSEENKKSTSTRKSNISSPEPSTSCIEMQIKYEKSSDILNIESATSSSDIQIRDNDEYEIEDIKKQISDFEKSKTNIDCKLKDLKQQISECEKSKTEIDSKLKELYAKLDKNILKSVIKTEIKVEEVMFDDYST